MKAKITRPDGTVIRLSGPREEVEAAVLAISPVTYQYPWVTPFTFPHYLLDTPTINTPDVTFATVEIPEATWTTTQSD